MGKSKFTKVALIGAILFITYNVVLFSIAGFKDHGPSFWISYGAVILGCLTAGLVAAVLKTKISSKKDWIFGYPATRHTALYVTVTTILSVVFMLLDNAEISWWVSLTVLLVVYAFYLVMVISCFIAQDTITEVHENIKNSTAFTKMLLVSVEMVAEKAQDPQVKEEFRRLAEAVRYSDPVSNQYLYSLEKQIADYVAGADRSVAVGDNATALQCCKLASQALIERNKRCKALK